MHREHQRAAEDQQVAGGYREAVAGEAQQVHSDNGEHNRHPDCAGHLLVQEYPQNRREDYVQRGDESALAHCGHGQPVLLQGGRHGQRQSAGDSADDGGFEGERLPFRFRRAVPEYEYHGYKHRAADKAAHAVERERSHGIHAGFLRHERHSPYHRRRQKQQAVP